VSAGGPFPFRTGGCTEIGPNPYQLEPVDYLLLDPQLGLFLVLDAGGSWSELRGRSGRTAADAIQVVVADWRVGGIEPRSLISQAFRAANESLRAEIDENGWHGGASVMLALFGEGRVHVSWVGDPMAHRVTCDRIEALTQPHTLWNECLRHGVTPTNPNFRNALLYSLGAQLPDPLEVISFVPQSGDRLILTTDGITNHIPENTILTACRTISDPTTCAEAIIEHALMAGSRDNCTCAVIAFD
jgi:protein phosphatase